MILGFLSLPLFFTSLNLFGSEAKPARKLRVAFIFAMGEEAKNLLNHYSFEVLQHPSHKDLPFKYYRYDGMKDVELIAAVNGQDKIHSVDHVGTVPAAINAFSLITNFNPDVVVSAGTAGGFKKSGLAIGEVVLSKATFWYHDRRIPLPGFAEYGLGGIHSFATDSIAESLSLKQAQISSGDSLSTSKDDFSVLEKTGSSVKEMESTAIAWVCREMGKPFFAIKSITDHLDVPQTEASQFAKNLATASSNLTKAIIRLVDLLNSKPQLIKENR